MQKIYVIVVAFLILAFINDDVVAQQQVYKCKNTKGKIEFSDSPCQGASVSERIQIQSNSVDYSGSREYQLRRENKQLKEQLHEQQRSSVFDGRAPQRTQPDLQAERIDSFACEKAKRDYEVTASSRANDSALVESRRSIMYGACGMREPDKNTINVETRINNFVR